MCVSGYARPRAPRAGELVPDRDRDVARGRGVRRLHPCHGARLAATTASPRAEAGRDPRAPTGEAVAPDRAAGPPVVRTVTDPGAVAATGAGDVASPAPHGRDRGGNLRGALDLVEQGVAAAPTHATLT